MWRFTATRFPQRHRYKFGVPSTTLDFVGSVGDSGLAYKKQSTPT